MGHRTARPADRTGPAGRLALRRVRPAWVGLAAVAFTALIGTHDTGLVDIADHVLRLEDGRLVSA